MKRLAVVVGGAHPMGIGLSAAAKLAANDFEVIVTGYTEAEVTSTPQISGVRAMVLDVTDDSAVKALFAGIDRLDALVNCAGTSSSNEYCEEGFTRTLDVNVTGTMRCCVAARPLLAVSKGAIVNVASIYSTFGSAQVPAYSASKGGVVQLTKSLAVAFGEDGINVNAIAPGWIRTNMARQIWENESRVAELVSRTPLGRLGEPSDCGDVIAFLCMPEARFVTGVTVPVDGGYVISG